MTKQTLEDVKILGEGSQLKKAICERYNGIREFYEQHKVAKTYTTFINYLSREVISSDSFKLNITMTLDVDFHSLFVSKQDQIKKHVLSIYDNIKKYDQESDQITFDYLLEQCKSEEMSKEAAMLYRAKARNYYETNLMKYCIEYYRYAVDALPENETSLLLSFHCELARDLLSENYIVEVNKRYKLIDGLICIHKDKLDDGILFFYHYWRGNTYMHNGEYSEARELLSTAVDYATKDYERAGAIANIGLSYKLQRRYSEAFKYYQDALNYQDPSRVLTTAAIYNNIAVLYKCKKEYKNALVYSEKAIEISEKENNLGKHLIYIATQAEVHMLMGNKEAYKIFLKLLLSTKGKATHSKPYILSDIKSFIEILNDVPCLVELADIIIELKNASTSDGYTKGLYECLGHIMDKTRNLDKEGI